MIVVSEVRCSDCLDEFGDGHRYHVIKEDTSQTYSDQERCGRRFCANHAAFEHPYVEPCFCLAGERHKQRKVSAADIAANLGKVSKPKRGFSRIGS